MKRAPVARRYADALLEIGAERGHVEKIREQIEAIANAFERSKEFRTTMLNPSIKLSERKAVMRQVAGRYSFDPMVTNFLLLLLDKDRARHLVDISHVLGELVDARAGRVRAEVTSATALNTAQTSQIKAQLLKLTGARSIELKAEVDASLIGGVIARVNGMVLDGSVRHQLEAMRAAILEEV